MGAGQPTVVRMSFAAVVGPVFCGEHGPELSPSGWDPPEGQKLPQRVSKVLSPMTPAVDYPETYNPQKEPPIL
ncbi:hypothetical protein STEG23_002579, partial [Scotinomys teguina]